MSTKSDEPEAKRAPKFTEAEKLALSAAARNKHLELTGKLSSTTTAKGKKNAWQEVTDEVNAVSSVTRTVSQIQEKYRNLRKEVKSAEAKRKRQMNGTGGGPSKQAKTEDWYDNILDTFADVAINGIKGGIDTSKPDRGTSSNATDNEIEVDPYEEQLQRPQRSGLIPAETESNDTSNQEVPAVNGTTQAVTSNSLMETPPSNGIIDTQQIPSKKTREKKKSVDELLQDQVTLVEQQLKCLEEIRDHIKNRNDIEKEKLELMRKKHSILFGDD